MKNILPVGATIAALLCIPGPSSAAESHRCSRFDEDVRRLACYDDAFGRPVRPAAVQSPAVAPATPPAVQRAAPAAPAPAPPPAAKPGKDARPADEPVSGRIVAVGRLSDERFAVTLDNGQLWTQLERDLTAEVRVGDTVQVRPAIFGSWILETRGGVRTRVKLAR